MTCQYKYCSYHRYPQIAVCPCGFLYPYTTADIEAHNDHGEPILIKSSLYEHGDSNEALLEKNSATHTEAGLDDKGKE